MSQNSISSQSLLLLAALRTPLALESAVLPRKAICDIRNSQTYFEPLAPNSLEGACLAAIIDGHETAALRFLRQGANENACDEVGLSLMHYAAQAGMLNLMTELQERGADCSAKSIASESVLTFALLCNSQGYIPKNNLGKVIDFLITYDADLDARDKTGYTAVMYASALGNLIALKKMHDGGANLLRTDGDGYDALCFAAMAGEAETVTYLLKNGADPCRKTLHGGGPTARQIVENRIDKDPQLAPDLKKKLIICRERLIAAEIISEAHQIAKHKIAGTDLTQTFNDLNPFRQVYLNATIGGDERKHNASLLMMGHMMGHAEPVLETPAYYLLGAAHHGNVQILQKVMQNRTPIDLRDGAGRSALSIAVLESKLKAVNLLLKHQADPDARDVLLMTPLMYAATLNDEKAVALLLNAGANPLLRDWQGLTAYDHAILHMAVDGNKHPSDDRTVPIEPLSFVPSPAAIMLKNAMIYAEQREKKLTKTAPPASRPAIH